MSDHDDMGKLAWRITLVLGIAAIVAIIAASALVTWLVMR